MSTSCFPKPPQPQTSSTPRVQPLGHYNTTSKHNTSSSSVRCTPQGQHGHSITGNNHHTRCIIIKSSHKSTRATTRNRTRNLDTPLHHPRFLGRGRDARLAALDMDDFDPSRGTACGGDGEVGGGACECSSSSSCGLFGNVMRVLTCFRLGV